MVRVDWDNSVGALDIKLIGYQCSSAMTHHGIYDIVNFHILHRKFIFWYAIVDIIRLPVGLDKSRIGLHALSCLIAFGGLGITPKLLMSKFDIWRGVNWSCNPSHLQLIFKYSSITAG